MFGFDVLVDRQQRPHLLEVNFAPSLNTDSDLDLEIKSKVRYREGGGGGRRTGIYFSVACLGRLTVDHALLFEAATGPTTVYDTR